MSVSASFNGDQIAGATVEALERGLHMACEVVLANTLPRTPIAEGDLRQSGRADAEGGRGYVSFNTPYAIRQHEDLTLNHPTGEAKFLEKTVNEMAASGEFLDIVAAAVRGVL